MKRKITKAIVIHHSASPRDTTTIEDVRRWHIAKGFEDIGYHYFISADGGVHIGRDVDDWGCHVKNWNDKSIGICLAGDFRYGKPTDHQTNALKEMLVKLCRKYNLKYWNIYGHKDIKWLFYFDTTQTECPGTMLSKRLSAIRNWVKEALERNV